MLTISTLKLRFSNKCSFYIPFHGLIFLANIFTLQFFLSIQLHWETWGLYSWIKYKLCMYIICTYFNFYIKVKIEPFFSFEFSNAQSTIYSFPIFFHVLYCQLKLWVANIFSNFSSFYIILNNGKWHYIS